jgi:hypothetical protein
MVPLEKARDRAELVTLAADTERAEAILYELAGLLRLVPLGEHTSHFCVRALDLKRDVSRWVESTPPESARHALIEELLALHEAVKARR